MANIKYSDSQIEAMIKGIEDGSIDEWNLPEGYYNAITDYLKKGIFEGFGSNLQTASKLDLPLLKELVTNAYMFGAAKTFQQTKEISSLLVDGEGNVRTSREFNTLAREMYNNWNDNWGRTEYNTAIAQGDAAAKWNEIEKQKDIMPVLEYSAIGDACDICQPLDGLTALVEDPIWDSIAPTNHFNCKCLLKQHGEYKELTHDTSIIVEPLIEKMKAKGQDIFINNVGKTGEIFTNDHPYFETKKEYVDYARRNFDLPLPKFAEQ